MMKDYVLYQDPDGGWHWLFDAFLCIEFLSAEDPGGSNKTFANGYDYFGSILESADKGDWEKLLDYYCQDDTGIGAIDAAVAEGIRLLGEPVRKRQIVICVPEPITYRYWRGEKGGTTYWGEIDGRRLDFSKTEDRIEALKWYVDTAIEKFEARHYANVELGGFYVTAERATYMKDILMPLGEYVKDRYYSFNWIPYFRADGFQNWKDFGFTYAYYQPNYFFSEDIGKDRLVNACETILEYGMDMEMEFDERVLESSSWENRLRDYMEYARDYGIWEKCRLAYYQGCWAVQCMKDSSTPEGRQLYHDFCQFVITRPIRDTH